MARHRIVLAFYVNTPRSRDADRLAIDAANLLRALAATGRMEDTIRWNRNVVPTTNTIKGK